MKIGYACINNSVGCSTNRTFRLASYSEELLKEKIRSNLDCLKKILKYNVQNGIFFFRISSDIIPFASHEICKFNWQKEFKQDFKEMGDFIIKNNMRISMHPDQFVLINALNKDIVRRSIRELDYHCDVLDLMGLDSTAKVQIHVGGVYGDKEKSIKRFIENYKKLPKKIKKRLAVENDDRSYSLSDCLKINKATGIPIIFDNLHHECLSNGEKMSEAIKIASKTWKKKDGVLMCDYSSQSPGERKGKHIKSINLKLFKKYLKEVKKSGVDPDIMFEIKDKEASVFKALEIIE